MNKPKNIPDRIGEYTITGHLNTGAFGHGLVAQTPDGNEVVIKLLRPDHAEGGRERYQNEIWALKKFDHKNIPRLIDTGTHVDQPYIVMERGEGSTLRMILRQQRDEGGPMTQSRALMIASQILEALAYAHSKGVQHRDVKDDNVVVSASASGVWLIDFGVCAGPGAPVEDITFLGVGAPRFSPPDKLRFPSESQANHDVFAVGVLLYLILTNEYPWSVSTSEDRGHLEHLMRQEQPQLIHKRNPFVHRAVSEFVSALLDIDDSSRPSAAESLKRLDTARSESGSTGTRIVSAGSVEKYHRTIRDPLHGDVLMTELEWSIISTPEFQRLRHIRQLGLANLVYPGAEHSRFSHAVGTTHVVGYILDRIARRSGVPFDPEEISVARVYALLHDLTHICFGHTIEDELGFFAPHDRNTGRIDRFLLSPSSAIAEVLNRHEIGRDVLAHFDPATSKTSASWVRELVDSPFGADAVDYIDRDSLFCGLDHKVDTAIFRRYVVDVRASTLPHQRHLVNQLFGQHGFRLDAEFALSSVLQERLGLFLKVYTHPAKIAAGAMLGKALYAASSGNGAGFSELDVEKMGDEELLAALRGNRRRVAKEIAGMLKNRRLYKTAFRSRLLDPDSAVDEYKLRRERLSNMGLFTPLDRDFLEGKIAKEAKVERSKIIVYCPPKAPGLQKVQNYVETKLGRPELRDEADKRHHMYYQQHLRLWTAYVFVHPDIDAGARERIGDVSARHLGLRNEASTDRRQLLFDY